MKVVKLNSQQSESSLSKNEFRQKLIQDIRSLSSEQRMIYSLAVQSQLNTALKGQTGAWGCFKSFSTEPQIDWDLVNSEIDWMYVEIQEENKRLVFRDDRNCIHTIEDLKGLCVPALGFHFDGTRLGRGGGYYDRELVNFKNIKIGLSFDLGVREDIPIEKHDQKVDVVITEQRVLDINSINTRIKDALNLDKEKLWKS